MAVVKSPRVFNVIYGDESYLLDRELDRALRWPDRTVIRLEGTETSEYEIISALSQPTFDESPRVVVVDRAEKVSLGAEFDDYLETRDVKDRSSLLVAICRSPSLPKKWSAVASKGRSTVYSKLKVWQESKLAERLSDEASLYRLKINEEAIDLLVRVYRDDSGRMANEIRKLSYLLDPGQCITREIVLKTCPSRNLASPWDVAEAALRKNNKKALRLVSSLLQDNGEGVLVPIVASMMHKVERALVMSSLSDREQTHQAIAASMGLHPYVVKKELPIVRRHSTASLRDQMKKLCELDVVVKGGSPTKRTMVEMAVLSLAA